MNKLKKNQSGAMAVDFMFALVLSLGMGSVVFAISYSLMTVEITQYIAFSAARSFSASHLTPDEQVQMARKKYRELTTNVAFKSLYSNGWFRISRPEALEVKTGIANDNFSKDYLAKGGDENANREVFHGVRIKFEPDLLKIKIPFLGSGDPDDEGFTTYINGILLRESSVQECHDYMKARVDALWKNDQGRAARFRIGNSAEPQEDNGC